MGALRDSAVGIDVGDLEFDHAEMVKARRLWADALNRGSLQEGDVELVKYLHVDAIRDRLAADLFNPWAWEEPEYSNVFLGDFDQALIDIKRLRVATELCIGLINSSDHDEHAPIIMLMTFMQWMLGQNDLAWQGTMLALAAQPGYSLAQMMQMLIMRGIRPRWMSRS
jgi:hypothetical protein